MIKHYDFTILGAGIYGLYATLRLAEAHPDARIALLEYDPEGFSRASYVNQARVHNGYHYPRSLATAKKSAHYYQRFNQDFSFALNTKFQKIYAIADQFSYTTPQNFLAFCEAADIPCTEIPSNNYFAQHIIASFATEEYSFDASKIKAHFLKKAHQHKHVDIIYNFRLNKTRRTKSDYYLEAADVTYKTPFVLNATYGSVNQVLAKFGVELFPIKYEIAEVCLCKVSDNLHNVGLTVMDGPFFSVMPFGLSGYHSLSAVHFTPHETSHDLLPTYSCQQKNPECTPNQLANCNTCPGKPATAWPHMHQLAKKYLRSDLTMEFHKSLMAIKPILQASELDDSRPTVIKTFSTNPTLISVLSGKINTLYDLDEIIPN